MFSGNTPPQAVRSSTRRATRRTSRIPASVPPSAPTTPRGGSPQPQTPQPSRALTSGLFNARAAARSPAPSASGAAGRRMAKASVGAMSEAGSVMEGDDIKRDLVDKVWARDENYTVLERKGLPTEVEAVILSADLYRDPFRSSLDELTGFAYLVSRQYCFVWNWASRSPSATTYIFPMPEITSLSAAVSIFSPLSFACLVPTSTQQSQREPGLLICSTTGEIRYWESVSMALSGVDRWRPANANLLEGELVRNITLLSPTSYLLSTSQARLLTINLTSIGGKTDVSVRPFDRSVGWAGSVWSVVFGSKTTDPRAGILALALSPSNSDGERVGYAVTEKGVQVWKLLNRGEGGERLLVEQDLFKGVLEGLAGGAGSVSNEDWALNEGKVEILDAVVAPNGALAVLVSHVTLDTAPTALSYSIVLLDVGIISNSVTAVGVRHVAYQAGPDPRPLSTPKLSLPTNEIAFIVFVNAIVMLSLSETTFEETFPLRLNTNRFLGISNPSPIAPPANSLTLLTSTASLLSIEVAASRELIFDHPGTEGFETRKLKSKIEQAIFFEGDDADNPLDFHLLPDYKGDLIAAAEAVSSEILSSSSANMPSILDLRVQLANRTARARALILFIGDNGGLGKLSQSSRRQLSWDAERLAAATALWFHHNSRLGDGESLLGEAISIYMAENGEAFAEDPTRSFYRTKVRSIGKILEQVTALAKRSLATKSAPEVQSATMQEANLIFSLVYNAISRHRKESATLYGLDLSVMPVEAWSSRPSILEGLQWQFDATDALLRQRVRELGTALDEEQSKYAERARSGLTDRADQQAIQAELKKQMTVLADFTFSAYEERLLFLQTTSGDAALIEARVLTDKYMGLRPRYIRTLISVDKVTHAYDLAERHGDFESLVELCNDPQHGSESRTRFFMQKYEEKFAYALYRYYLATGQQRILLEQDEIYRGYLTSFLDSTDETTRISWLNDFAIARYSHAAESLASEASREQNLSQQRLMLSLAKLSQVAQTTYETIGTEEVQRAIEATDDRLDLVNSQQALCTSFQQSLSLSLSRLTLEKQGEAITQIVAPNLHDRPAFAQLYARFSKSILEGSVVDAEGLIDLLTLKENNGEDGAEYAAALEILVRAKRIPETRKEIALQSIWRRVYLRDNWAELKASASLKDEQLAEALKTTALYMTLDALAEANLPADYYLDPNAAIFNSSAEEISPRFATSGSSPQFIDLLLNDYERENEKLREALQSFGLGEYFGEVARLFSERGAIMEEM